MRPNSQDIVLEKSIVIKLFSMVRLVQLAYTSQPHLKVPDLQLRPPRLLWCPLRLLHRYFRLYDVINARSYFFDFEGFLFERGVFTIQRVYLGGFRAKLHSPCIYRRRLFWVEAVLQYNA